MEPGDGRPPEAQIYDLVQEMVEEELLLYTGDQTSIPHDDMIDCMADLTDEEVMRDFTPPEAGAPTGAQGESARRKETSNRLFAR